MEPVGGGVVADEVGKGIANRGWGEEDGAGEQVGGR